LKPREPSDVALKAVASFARKIGEIASLSRVDLKLLALTYMFESEVNGTDHIKTEPLSAPRMVEQSNEISTSEQKQASDDSEKNENKNNEEMAEPNNDHAENDTNGKDNNEKIEPNNESIDASDDKVMNEYEEDEGGDWITPDNLEAMKVRHGKGEVAKEPLSVGCITADFAMQNVLLQMGLKVVSFDGLIIKRTQQFVLRCYSCNKFCKNVEKQFCPVCGNNTMVKVVVKVNDHGDVQYYQVQKINKRGAVYAIPLPKGGRNSKDLILTEDHMIEKMRFVPRKKDDSLDDYEFASSKAGPRRQVVVGYGHKNPNISKKRIGKKNKKITSTL